MNTVTFVHLSDLRADTFGPSDPPLPSGTRAALAAVVAAFGRLSPPPSFAALSGDLSGCGDPDSCRAVRGASSGLCRPGRPLRRLCAGGARAGRAGAAVGRRPGIFA